MEESSVKSSSLSSSNNNNENSTKRSNNTIIINKVIPIKKYVRMDDMYRQNTKFLINLMKNQKNQEIRNTKECVLYLQDIIKKGGAEFQHNNEEFCMVCICKMCLQYREIILQLMNDCIKTQNMWKVLQATIKKFYEPIIEKVSSNTAKKIYENSLNDVRFNWLSKGVLDHTKLQHIDFMSDLSLTDNMTFVLLSALLTVEDAHQLFELLSYQIECITRAYGEGLREKILINSNIGDDRTNSEDLLMYILQGYEELNKIAGITSDFLFAFESKYLKQFELSWSLINKRMYQKWVHSEFSAIMLQCIRKLKDEVDSDRYQEIVRQYVSFDEEMTSVNIKWHKAWMNLNDYYSLTKEEARQKHLKNIHNMLREIRIDAATVHASQTFQDINKWEEHPNRQLVWQSMMVYIKEKWPPVDWIRLCATNLNHYCKKCTLDVIQRMPCNCITCLVVDGPPSKIGKDIFCFKCRATERLQSNVHLKMPNINEVQLKEDESSSIKDMKCATTSKPYHLSWAVFKHLKDRQKYPYSTIDEGYFCSNCNRTSCQLAKKILNNEMAFGLSQYLVNHYQPFSMTHDEMAEMLPNIMLYNRKVISMNLTNDPPTDDIVVKTFWTFIISAFASYFVDAEVDVKKPNLQNLKLINNDIELPMEYIELNNKAIKFLDFIEKIKGLLQSDSHCQVHSKALKDTKAVNNNSGNDSIAPKELKKEEKPTLLPEKPKPKVVHPVESTSKNWEKNFPKNKHHGIQCCSDHLEELENCKENHFSKMCFHEKECSHTRINETRDRLRKKLSQLTNAKKNAIKTINEGTTSINDKLRTNLVKNNVMNNSNNNKPRIVTTSTASSVESSQIKDNTAMVSTSNSRNIRNENKREISTKLVVAQSSKISQKNCDKEQSLGGNSTNNPSSLSTVATPSTSKQEQQFDINMKNTMQMMTKITSSIEMMNNNNNENDINGQQQHNHDENFDEWINNTLNFIEGCCKEIKKSDRTINNKKAAKKAKQKQKKEEQKRTEELQELRSQFHELYFKEFIAKTELKNQKSLKKKDKRRITELEAVIKKVNKSKSKLETSILELISTVKALNADFKFSYLPTKEQQQEVLSKTFPEETATMTTAAAINAKNEKQQQRGKKLPINQHMESSSSSSAPTLFQEIHPSSVQQFHQHQPPYGMQGNLMIHQHNFHQPSSFQQTAPPPTPPTKTTYAPPGDNNNDATKRIVTIRRVTLPHAAEPQVTVTAKGESPDKDKLLYTFINGQLVPAGSLDSQILNVLHTQAPFKVTKMQQLSSNESKLVDAQPKTKTQLKKERKRAKKALEEQQKELQAVVASENKTIKLSPQQSITSDDSSEIQDSKMTKNKKAKKGEQQRQQNQQQTQQKQQISKSKNLNSSKASGSEKKQMETISGNSSTASDSKATRNKSNNNSITNTKVVDNGQFDNNQFKMLHLDELMEFDEVETKTTSSGSQSSKTTSKSAKTSTSNNVSSTNSKKNKGKTIQNQNNVASNISSIETSSRRNSGSIVEQKNSGSGKNQKLMTPTAKNNEEASIIPTNKLQKINSNSSSSQSQKSNKKTTKKQINVETPMTTNSTEHLARNLHHSMQKLHLNADTTIEPASRPNSEMRNSSSSNLNISIMEQLNRGVQVEDLTLPPGITLTKVDPSRAEMLRAKTESIGKLSQPMQTQPQSSPIPPPTIIAPSLIPPHLGNYGVDQTGVIMVDAMNLKQRSRVSNNVAVLNETENKNKIKKRKNKKKKGDTATTSVITSNKIQQQSKKGVNTTTSAIVNGNSNDGGKLNEPKMVTLRNPMFHSPSAVVGSNPVFPLQNKIPVAPLPVDQPAAIIKNENGMFTIRNPALHQAFLNGLQTPNFRQQYNPAFVPSTKGNENFVGEYSYFSGNSAFQNGFYNGNDVGENHNNNKGKCLSAIGSEIKNAQQQKKLNNQWQTTSHPHHHSHPSPQQHQSQCFNNAQHAGCGSGYLSQSIDQCSPIQENYHRHHHPQQQHLPTTNYYNGYDVFASQQNNIENRSSLFSNSSAHHNCGDDSPPPSVTGFNRYLDGFSENENKYDDMPFLNNLIPGQRLNSEVTIHNINESKFNRNNNNISPTSHRVEITPISRPSSRPNNGGGVGLTTSTNDICGNNYGDNILFNKHRNNLNDNQFIDNDLSSTTSSTIVKQQNQQHYNYGFDSTSSSSSLSNDFKVNINLNDIQQRSPTIAQQQQQQNSSRSSPYLSNHSESTIDSFVHSMNSLKLSSDDNMGGGCINGNRWW